MPSQVIVQKQNFVDIAGLQVASPSLHNLSSPPALKRAVQMIQKFQECTNIYELVVAIEVDDTDFVPTIVVDLHHDQYS